MGSFSTKMGSSNIKIGSSTSRPQPSPKPAPKPSPLLTLPPELRLLIYTHAIPELHPNPPSTPLLHPPTTYTPLLYTHPLILSDLYPEICKSVRRYMDHQASRSKIRSLSNMHTDLSPQFNAQMELRVDVPYSTLYLATSHYNRAISRLYVHRVVFRTYHPPNTPRLRSNLELRCLRRYVSWLGHWHDWEDLPTCPSVVFVWGEEQDEDRVLMGEVVEEVERRSMGTTRWRVRWVRGGEGRGLKGVVLERVGSKGEEDGGEGVAGTP
ncbi:hypothetical protein P154DRAFT_616036 [Amniculicola lignicola CBS 123094]|uniref:Uncharacterized protein n=1 Tax=Amniculicola lignicola CBS 123094 TaxID=1392246 RepID=A0A6A5WZH3_9PLEO|nr:hypothetical protein P154DRAFT_616036 [Amniculicola lignicola CBS 123094]